MPMTKAESNDSSEGEKRTRRVRQSFHKRKELSMLQDSLTGFFTPSTRRRTTIQPDQADDVSSSSAGLQPPKQSSSRNHSTAATAGSMPKRGRGRGRRSYSVASHADTEDNVAVAEIVPKLNRQGQPTRRGRRPRVAPLTLEAALPPAPAQLQRISSTEQTTSGSVRSRNNEPLVFKRAYYKGYYFYTYPDGISNCRTKPPGLTPEAIIELFKVMEKRHRKSPDWLTPEVNSDTEYEFDGKTLDDFGGNDVAYFNYVTIMDGSNFKHDGLTHTERRENREFYAEFQGVLKWMEGECLAFDKATVRRLTDKGIQLKAYNAYNQRAGFDWESELKVLICQTPAAVPGEFEKLFRNDRDAFHSRSPSPATNYGIDGDDDEIIKCTERLVSIDIQGLNPEKIFNEILGVNSNKPTSKKSYAQPVEKMEVDNDFRHPPGNPLSNPSHMGYRRLVHRSRANIQTSAQMQETINKFAEHCHADKTLIAENIAHVREQHAKKPLPNEQAKNNNVKLEFGEFSGNPSNSSEYERKRQEVWKKDYWTTEDAISSVTNERDADILREFLADLDSDRYDRLSKVMENPHPSPRYLMMNAFRMETVRSSPFPEYIMTDGELYLCDLCLYGSLTRKTYDAHMENCYAKAPPGKLIYHDSKNAISIYEVDPLMSVSFCRQISCVGQSFIDHKELSTDIEPFLYYVLTVTDKKDRRRNRIAGYFSKQKYGHSPCNLCCLLVLPCYQGKKYGRFLVDFSFLLSRIEKKPGLPERPLSKAADSLYYNYFVDSIEKNMYQYYFEQTRENAKSEVPFSLDLLEELTGIEKCDLLSVAIAEKLAFIDRVTKEVTFDFGEERLLAFIERMNAKKYIFAQECLLKWDPRYSRKQEEAHFPQIREERRRLRGLPTTKNEDEESSEDDLIEIQRVPTQLVRGVTAHEAPVPEVPKIRKKTRKRVVVGPRKRRHLKTDPNDAFSWARNQHRLREAQLKANAKFLTQKKQPKTGAFVAGKKKPGPKRRTRQSTTSSSSESEAESDSSSEADVDRRPLKRKPVTSSSDDHSDHSSPSEPDTDRDANAGNGAGGPSFSHRRSSRQSPSNRQPSPQQSDDDDDQTHSEQPKTGQPGCAVVKRAIRHHHVSSDDEDIQHCRVRIRGSSLSSSSSDGEHHPSASKRSTRRKRITKQDMHTPSGNAQFPNILMPQDVDMNDVENIADGNPAPLLHVRDDETLDFDNIRPDDDPYADGKNKPAAPILRPQLEQPDSLIHDPSEPKSALIPIEAVVEEVEMPQLQAHETHAVPLHIDDDADDDAPPPMLSPNYENTCGETDSHDDAFPPQLDEVTSMPGAPHPTSGVESCGPMPTEMQPLQMGVSSLPTPPLQQPSSLHMQQPPSSTSSAKQPPSLLAQPSRRESSEHVVSMTNSLQSQQPPGSQKAHWSVENVFSTPEQMNTPQRTPNQSNPQSQQSANPQPPPLASQQAASQLRQPASAQCQPIPSYTVPHDVDYRHLAAATLPIEPIEKHKPRPKKKKKESSSHTPIAHTLPGIPGSSGLQNPATGYPSFYDHNPFSFINPSYNAGVAANQHAASSYYASPYAASNSHVNYPTAAAAGATNYWNTGAYAPTYSEFAAFQKYQMPYPLAAMTATSAAAAQASGTWPRGHFGQNTSSNIATSTASINPNPQNSNQFGYNQWVYH